MKGPELEYPIGNVLKFIEDQLPEYKRKKAVESAQLCTDERSIISADHLKRILTTDEIWLLDSHILFDEDHIDIFESAYDKAPCCAHN